MGEQKDTTRSEPGEGRPGGGVPPPGSGPPAPPAGPGGDPPEGEPSSGETPEGVPQQWHRVGRAETVAGRFRELKGELKNWVGKQKGPKGERFDKFTERAKKVLVLAQEEAQRFNHNYIGTEHLLLGLVREGEGIAGKVLGNLGIDLGRVREAVEFIIGRGDRKVTGDVSLTPRAKKVIELAVDESRLLNHNYIGTEHLLLGLVREGEGIAAGVMESLGASMEKVRAAMMQVLSSPAYQPTSTASMRNVPKDNVITCRIEDLDLNAIDALVEAGIRSTRSDAAAWLIRAGIDANRTLFERVNATVAQIRRLREQAQAMAEEVAGGGAGQAAPEDLSAEQEPRQEGDGGAPGVAPETGRPK